MSERDQNSGDSIEMQRRPFSVSAIQEEISAFLLAKKLAPKTVDVLLRQFKGLVDETGQGDLDNVLEKFLAFIKERRMEHSDSYRFFHEYLKSKQEPAVPNPAFVDTFRAIKAATEDVSSATAQVIGSRVSSHSEPDPFVDVMDKGLDNAIKAFFPSISQFLMAGVRLVLTKTSSTDEGADFLYKMSHFLGLVDMNPSLEDDLKKHGVPLERVVRTLAMCGQLEMNRNIASASRNRGKLSTLTGEDMNVALAAMLVQERAIASQRGTTAEEVVTPADVPTTPPLDQPAAIEPAPDSPQRVSKPSKLGLLTRLKGIFSGEDDPEDDKK